MKTFNFFIDNKRNLFYTISDMLHITYSNDEDK